jgi:hypothetical protein
MPDMANTSQISPQMRQANAAAAELMATLQLSEATIPRAGAFPGAALQGQRPIPAQAFYGIFSREVTRKGLDASPRYIDGQAVDPYNLFLIVCRFGGHAEVSKFSPFASQLDTELLLTDHVQGYMEHGRRCDGVRRCPRTSSSFLV